MINRFVATIMFLAFCIVPSPVCAHDHNTDVMGSKDIQESKSKALFAAIIDSRIAVASADVDEQKKQQAQQMLCKAESCRQAWEKDYTFVNTWRPYRCALFGSDGYRSGFREAHADQSNGLNYGCKIFRIPLSAEETHVVPDCLPAGADPDADFLDQGLEFIGKARQLIKQK